ncbi:MAG TPA: acetate--CoA ligase family protein [Syntrophales bacterium]|nr:acetate--CoA ligase family protein [Syntrophales bacterium]HOX93944.1 acetate--CoA ligase family protein [Syntrophales bacterium]HPI56115.1 acetate--CoA ligase family protein [Syntrophales bacterium]HPN23995.1 acetate--CoA ligase family protein [Syntrophales bacterium]HQM28274.1 acetate--CoA ligase family protein [Syntrophales bacterium]
MRLFFEPKSVALIGAPRKTGTGTYNNVEMLLRYGYKGAIYPVNPKADEIYGVRSYPSVMDAPEVPDLAVISLGRELVIPAFGECIRKGVRRVVIISQGFADADARGKELQSEIAKRARESGVRVVGPNTMGVLNNFSHFTTAFVDLKPPEKVFPVAIIAQTGVIQVAADTFSYRGWGKAIDIGNSCDLDYIDALNYFADDPQTSVIALHMEGMLRGREFLEMARRITRKKPVIVLKTGWSTAGAKAALSHTGMLAGEDEVNDTAFESAGVIRVKETCDMQTAIHALLLMKEMKGPRIGVITISGAAGIMTVDACEELGLTLAKLPPGLAVKLKEGIPDWLHVGHPIDIWPIGMIGGNYRGVFGLALTELLTSKDVDGILGILPTMVSPLHKDIELMEVIAASRERAGNSKPVALWAYPTDPPSNERFELTDGVACFRTIEEAVRGLAFSHRYHRNRTAEPVSPPKFSVQTKKADRLIREGRKLGHLIGEDALDLLRSFGIACVKGKTAGSWTDIRKASAALRYPLVLKLAGRAFLHKSEWGGVITGIEGPRGLKEAHEGLLKNVRKRNRRIKVESFQVQEMAKGRELILGLKLDPQYGHVILCGLGGIYTEIFRDVSREIVPIDRRRAERMVKALKMYPLLQGVRGEKGIDMEGLLDTLERLSFLAAEVPDLKELDINPLMAGPKGVMAADARILW